jgi:hypothetical protein
VHEVTLAFGSPNVSPSRSRYQATGVQAGVTVTSSVAVSARSPDVLPLELTEFPHAVNVTIPVAAGFGVHSTVKTAVVATRGLECVASDQPEVVCVVIPATTLAMILVLVEPGARANVPCWLDRRLKPAAFCAAHPGAARLRLPGAERQRLQDRQDGHETRRTESRTESDHGRPFEVELGSVYQLFELKARSVCRGFLGTAGLRDDVPPSPRSPCSFGVRNLERLCGSRRDRPADERRSDPRLDPSGRDPGLDLLASREEERSNVPETPSTLDACAQVALATGGFGGSQAGDAGDHDDTRWSRREQRYAAEHERFNLHAGVHLPAADIESREKLYRYALRPCFALERLPVTRDSPSAGSDDCTLSSEVIAQEGRSQGA